MSERIIIVGGVAGGASVATRLRRLNEDAEITIYEAGPYISFANCGLPYYVGKTIADRENLFVSTPDDMRNDFNIDIHVNSEVTAIDSAAKTITVQTPEGSQQDHYDKLVLSIGASPVIPHFPGLVDSHNVFTVRTVPDVDQITEYIEKNSSKHATVVGGGFIGLEMVENLRHRGLEVTLVEATPQVMPNLDFEMAQFLHEHLAINGVDLRLNTKLEAFTNSGHTLKLAGGDTINTDLVILAIGVKPNSQLAKDAGVKTNERGFISVNKHFETNLPDVYAIGDVISVENAITKQTVSIPLAGPANHQGRYLADDLAGFDRENPAVLGTSVAKVFALTTASTGANEWQLKALDIPYQVIHLHPNSSAGYYPGAAPIELKVLFSPDDQILGAQAVGTKGVAKRIDVISTAIRFHAKVAELADIEVAYAPPYASAKDPVNFAGYMAGDIQDKLVTTIQWHEVDGLLAKGAYFLDVRNPDELLAEPALKNAVNIPRSQIRQRLAELPTDQPIYVYCAAGLRGYNVARVLNQRGFNAINLDGGLKTYRTAKYQLTHPNHKTAKSAVQQKEPQAAPIQDTAQVELDACGLQCPGPILKVKTAMQDLADGQQLKVTASDFGFYKDIDAWANATNNTVVSNEIQGDKVVATVQKGQDTATCPSSATDPAPATTVKTNEEGTTIVVFDGDFDKAIASLIIAQGAAAMGQPVTMFFTFWGLNVIKKPGVKLRKKGMAKMFDIALPHGAQKLPLSKLNMLGAGRNMMKKLMHSNNVDQLDTMLQKAQDAGVKMVACTMSMDLMGVQKEELIDGIEFGGVAAYLGDARQRNTSLFI
ncbi:FAD-dependent oxidoreductase [Secundilactobacillus yichangensis]|uniref:FAD-dependent oxidoreductase n=1 Tax=Secundilactobacillus yichangensis TaxID=2799580 RepID=UPI0019422116|nr:FAD-dependent oxidoreductase [Secundilactobacillus yichangensis]